MSLIVLFLGLSCYYYSGVQGMKDEVLNTTESMAIAHRYLFVGDVIEISIIDLRVAHSELSKAPLMMISVMKDRTLGYDIDPFFPYMKQRKPVLDLNAAENNRDFIFSSSTVALKIDFPTKTLINDPSSSMIYLYANISSIVRDNSSLRNGTKDVIEMTSSELNETVLYNLTFAFPIDTVESQGLYKIYLHSYENVPMQLKVSMPSLNISVILHSVQFVLWLFIFCCICMHLFWLYSRLRNLEAPIEKVFPFYISLYQTLFTAMMLHATTTWEMKRMRKGTMNAEIMIKIVILSFQLISVMYGYFLYWKKWNSSGIFHKTDKAFHIFVLLIMMHFCLQYYYTAPIYLITYPLSDMLNNGYFGVIENCFLYLYLTIFISATTHKELRSPVLILGFRKRFWLTRCIFAGYFFIVSFNLILATMTSLALPFYFHFVQIAIEDILKMLPWWIGFECARYQKYIDNNPQDLAAAA